MYTEEYEQKGFPIKGFLIRLLLVVIFVLLLIWLLPKILSPVLKTDGKIGSSCNGSATCDLSGLNALTSQIYSDNIEKMKNAAISYYTAERLPKQIGESSTMTLSDMIGKKIISPLIDKNNKAVDVEGSYVKITKMDNEYLLKVNLKDSEKEDYVLVHLGCYSYCESYVCQKQTTTTTGTKGGQITSIVPIIVPSKPEEPTPTPSVPKCEYRDGKYYDGNGNRVSELNYIVSCQAPKCRVVNGYYFGKNGNNVSKSTYEYECTSSQTYTCEYKNGSYYDRNGNNVSEVDYIISCQAPKCKIVNGFYFGKNGNNVSKTTYNKECTTSPSYTCEYRNGKYYNKNGKVVSEVDYIISCQAPKCKVVNGYYFGKDGDNVSKSTYEAECTTPTTYTCEYRNGKYYNKNGKVVSEVEYIISCQAPKCKIVNGYYFGKNGNNVSKSTYESECTTQQEYEYEYVKRTDAVLSQWTPWGAWDKTDCATDEINCSDQDNTCLFKLQRLTRKEKIGNYQRTYARTRNVMRQTGSYQVKACNNYNYVEINKKLYLVTKTTTYTTVTTHTVSVWVSTGTGSYGSAPDDTADTQYVFVGADYSGCDASCTTLPNFYYEQYSYNGDLTGVSSTTSTKSHTTVTVEESEELISEDTTYEASCGGFDIQTVPVYSTIKVTEKASRTEPLYGDVCYKSTKSRTVITPASEQKKWSKYNDTSLLNAGWTYTGNKKLK